MKSHVFPHRREQIMLSAFNQQSASMARKSDGLTALQLKRAEIDKQIKSELLNLISDMRDDIQRYGLTVADLFGKVATKAAAKTSAKYAHPDGRTWSGRGPRPGWLAEAIAAGASLEDFLVGANSSKRKASGKNAAAKSARKTSAKSSASKSAGAKKVAAKTTQPVSAGKTKSAKNRATAPVRAKPSRSRKAVSPAKPKGTKKSSAAASSATNQSPEPAAT